MLKKLILFYLLLLVGNAFGQCTVSTFPWTESFEKGYTSNSDIAGCWKQESIDGSSSWQTLSGSTSVGQAPRTGSYSASLSTGNGDWLYYGLNLVAETTYEIELYARQGTADSTHSRIALSIGTGASVAEMTTILVPERGLIDGVYQRVAATFKAASTGLYYMGIQGRAFAYTGDNVTIDDITVRVVPCPAPKQLHVKSIVSSTPTLAWTPEGVESNWDVEYGTTGFVLGTGTKTTSTKPEATLSGLSVGGNYQFYVRANCGSGSTSTWAGPFDFTVDQCAVGVIPWSENFDAGYTENAALTGCWLQAAIEGTTSWSAKNTYGATAIARSGLLAGYLDVYQTRWLFKPMQMDAGKTYTIEMYARQLASQSFLATVTLAYGFKPDAASMTNVIASKVGTTNSYSKIQYSFTPSVTAVYYFGIKGFVSGSGCYLAIDDITVVALERPTALTGSTTARDAIALSWTNGGNASKWEIEYAPVGSSTKTRVIANSNPFTLTGLSDETMYEIRVRGINPDNDISLWSDVFKCSTPSVAMPWFEGFESGTIANWLTQSIVGSNKWRTYNGTTVGNAPFAGKYSAFLDYNNNTWMFHPVYLDANKTYEFSMWARQDGTVATNASITVQYGSAATAASMTNTIVAKTGLVNGNYQQLTAKFAPSASGVYHIGIFGNINSTPYFIEVDNISLSTCFQPTALTSTSVTAKEVSLSWTAGASETDWEIQYGIKDFTLGTGTLLAAKTNSSTISGLVQGTTYQFYVRSLCSANDASVWAGPYQCTIPYSCPKPTNTLVTATSINSAKLAWTAGGTETAWQVQYGATNFVLGAGTNELANNNPYTLTGLTANKEYKYNVRAVCAVGDTSEWSVPANFITPCSNPVTTFPITQDFESTTFPNDCWTLYPNTNVYDWKATQLYSPFNIALKADFFNIRSGNKFDLISPDFDATSLLKPKVAFRYAYATNGTKVDNLDVYYSLDGGINYTLLQTLAGGTTGTLNTGGASTSSFSPNAYQWKTAGIYLPAGTNKVKLTARSANGNNLFIDDISIMEGTLSGALTYTQSANGKIVLMNGTTVISSGAKSEIGSKLTVTATPNSGYEVASITVDGTPIDLSGAYTTTAGAHVFAASFVLSNYTITYNNTTGATNTNPAIYTIQSPTITLAAPTKTDYTFKGWFANSALSGTEVTSIATGSTGNKELWAKWASNTPSTSVSFTQATNGNIAVSSGGKSVNSGDILADGSVLTITATPNAGYQLSTLTVNGTTIANGGTFTLNADNVTILASFSPIAYAITYSNTTGAVNTNPTSYTVESAAITLASPTKAGYTFGGWFDNSSLTGTAVTTITAGSTSAKSFWAKWTKVAVNVTVNFTQPSNGTISVSANNAAITSGASIAEGTLITITASPNTGYDIYFYF